MASLTLELTGKGGLAPRFSGDLDRTTATQNLRYIGGEDQMADGIYNPFRRFGYMSPSNAVFNAVTDGSTENFTFLAKSSIYDAVNDDFYIGTSGTYYPKLYKGDGLDDIALSLSQTFTASKLYDLEIYQINGVRKLFSVQQRPAMATLATTLGSSVNWLMAGNFINAATAGTNPTLNSSARETAASGTTLTKSITVAAGDNRFLYVMAGNYTGTAAVSATYNGVAMTVGNTTTLFSMSFTEFYTIAPTVTTADVVVTWPSSQNNLVLHAFVFQGASQSALTGFAGSGNTSTSAAMNTQQGYLNTLFVGTLLSATATHTVTTGTEVFNAANTVGHDSSSYIAVTQGNLEVGIATLPYASADTDWLTGTAAGGFTSEVIGEAFMEVADNGFAYLFHDNVVDKIDGTTNGGSGGTVTANVLIFPAYFRCVDAVDYRGLMFIGIHQYSTDIRAADDTIDSNTLKCGVYLWDRLSTVVQTRDYIPIEGIKQIRKVYVSPSGKLRAIVINSERVVEIREYTGSTFEPIQEVGYNAYPAFRDSVASYSNTTTWLGRDGIIYSYGKVAASAKEALYKIGTLTDVSTTAVSTGMILFGGEDTGSTSAGYKTQKHGLYLGYYNGSNNKIKEWDMYGTGSTGSTAVTKTQAQGDVYTLVKYLPQMSTVKDIEIFCAPGGSSGSTTAATVKIYFNQSATAWASKVITLDDAAKGYKRIEVNKPFVNAVQLEIEFNTAATIGIADFAPSMAVIEYDPTNARG